MRSYGSKLAAAIVVGTTICSFAAAADRKLAGFDGWGVFETTRPTSEHPWRAIVLIDDGAEPSIIISCHSTSSTYYIMLRVIDEQAIFADPKLNANYFRFLAWSDFGPAKEFTPYVPPEQNSEWATFEVVPDPSFYEKNKEFVPQGAVSGLKRMAACVVAGAISLRTSTVFSTNVASMLMKPVTLPPGCARLATNPLPTGSDTTMNTRGIVRVCCSRAAVAIVVCARAVARAPQLATLPRRREPR